MAGKAACNDKKGFTLIELIMIIVILGIIAAVAVPRYMDISDEAQKSVGHGITAALQGAITMLHARYLLKNQDYSADDVVANIDHPNVTMTNSSDRITATLQNGHSFEWIYTDRNGSQAAQVKELSGF